MPDFLPRPAVRDAVWRAVLRRPDGAVGGVLVLAVCAAALLAPWLAPQDPLALSGRPLSAPSGPHLMGTDALGRDMLSAVLYGARTSLFVAMSVTGLALLLGTAVGMVSGYYGRWLDDVLMRVTEFAQAVPRFFLAIAAIALLGPGLDRLIAVLALTSWTGVARVVRSQVLSLKEHGFVAAAQAGGASGRRIMARHLLPNVAPAALVVAGLALGQVILIEASLGFLGLADPNVVSWGALAAQAQQFLRAAWWLSVFPGVAILGTVLGFNLLADAGAAGITSR